MKRLFGVFLILFFLFSCTTGNDPEATARAFLRAMEHGNTQKACRLSLPQCHSSILLLDSLAKHHHPSWEFIELKILPDSAHAACRYLNVAGKEDLLYLVKQGDRWLVDFQGI
ncbi:MAG: hypothetical protein FJY10_06075 [Bacteroidetes bacterium]|nr:hypothetical protein [Bacteroidota bacterium]